MPGKLHRTLDRALDADILDELRAFLPADFDWRTVVKRYPVGAVAGGVTLGWLLGGRQGKVLLGAASAAFAAALAGAIEDLFSER